MTLDTQTALIVIDLQKGITSFPTAHPIGPVLANAGRLTQAFRQKNLPVVLVNVDGQAPGRAEQSRKLENLPADWTEFVPELDRQPHDHVVTKRTWGAFTHTDLHQHLYGLAVTQVVVIGVATCAGGESTARFAHELGYNVTLVSDAMTDMSAEAHENSLQRIFPRIGEVGTTDQVLGLLGG
jgi:nicotinamidase-related amidase